jgi:DNA polymerase alpha subunit B
MFTTLDERSRALDKHLMTLQESMCNAWNITEVSPVGIPSPDTVWVCGRVCNESSEGNINKTSIVLEGSKLQSAGRRVLLDITEVQQYALFPGQIIMVEGINPSGRKMIAKRIIEGMPAPHVTTPSSKIMEYQQSPKYQGGKPLNILVAAGPFTTSDNLLYEPLVDILSLVGEKKPDVLILIGPFVDISQPLLSSGQVLLQETIEDEMGNVIDSPTHEASYEMVFVEKIIRDGIGAYFNSEADYGGELPTNIILVPSLQDGHHECVFPQPPFGDRDAVETPFFKEPLGILKIPFSNSSDPRQRVHLVPNPCMLRYYSYMSNFVLV